MLIAADPAIVDAAVGGAQAHSATGGNSSIFSQTLGELRAVGPPANATTAPQFLPEDGIPGQPLAATVAASSGQSVPPVVQLTASETPLAATATQPGMAAGSAGPDTAVGESRRGVFDEADDAGESSGGESPAPLISEDLAHAGLTLAPMRESGAFLHHAFPERGFLPAAQSPFHPGSQAAVTDSANAPASVTAPGDAKGAFPMAAGNPQIAGVETGMQPRPDTALSQLSAGGKGSDAPVLETGDLPGLMVSDLGVRDVAPRSFAVDPRDAGPLTPNRPGFADALAQRVSWFARSDGGDARLELDPPHLGPLEVSVRVEKGEASVVFIASQTSVRDAVSQAIPELRNLFAQSGLSLGNVNVSAGGAGHQAFSSPYRYPSGSETERSAEGLPRIPVVAMRQGLVDLYA